jgi:uncharacterized protein with FMN-binding domain
MRRIVIALASTVTGLVLLFSWPTSLNRPVAAAGPAEGTAGTAGAGSSTTGSGTTSDGTAPSAGTDAQAPAAQAPTPATTAQTFTGAAAQTRYGNVTVQITVTDGRLTDAQAVEYPQRDRRDQQINGYAIPILDSEAVAAGSASIQTVSGATFTSQGYVASLQDALDQAGL